MTPISGLLARVVSLLQRALHSLEAGQSLVDLESFRKIPSTFRPQRIIYEAAKKEKKIVINVNF